MDGSNINNIVFLVFPYLFIKVIRWIKCNVSGRKWSFIMFFLVSSLYHIYHIYVCYLLQIQHRHYYFILDNHFFKILPFLSHEVIIIICNTASELLHGFLASIIGGFLLFFRHYKIMVLSYSKREKISTTTVCLIYF